MLLDNIPVVTERFSNLLMNDAICNDISLSNIVGILSVSLDV